MEISQFHKNIYGNSMLKARTWTKLVSVFFSFFFMDLFSLSEPLMYQRITGSIVTK